jgi:plasmid stabilization system protein ParE
MGLEMANKKYNVVLSSRAETMLMRHVEFLARVSKPAARRLSAEFRKSQNGLKTNPERYPFLELDGIPPRIYRKCLFYDRYELVFLIIENIVHIDAVRDCRQNPDNIFDI